MIESIIALLDRLDEKTVTKKELKQLRNRLYIRYMESGLPTSIYLVYINKMDEYEKILDDHQE